MPQSTPSEEDSAQGAAPIKQRRSSGGFSFPFGMARTRSMGTGGLAAASIGWVMAGCTAFGFAVGAWLDKKLGTGFWMPTLTFVGVAAGFREMFVTIGQISRHQAQDRNQRAKTSPSAPSSGAPHGSRGAKETEQASEPTRQRLFSVPPPPFMEQPKAGQRDVTAEEVQRHLSGEAEVGEEGRHAV